ncbi:PKD domain-containing protein [Flavobacterium sp. MK4S-17]|uniref:PKD domain-containing protein n=1 Tax=Flavobacterium sp. MK4S-17 TaxID=2543737 RepID=UPI001359AC07|nr:PKD domain-containing protein [Flavobacterium sp. MK4S-17]
MKRLKYIITFVFAALLLGCSEDESSLDSLTGSAAPSDISALFTITQDNTGVVTITPSGQAVTKYEVYFGDGTEEPGEVRPGGRAMHTYAEGIYNVKVVGYNLNGDTAEYNHELTVSFIAPENLSVDIIPVTGDAFSIDVEASADYEAFFEVTYGEDPAQEPVQFNEGQVIRHTYGSIGTYTVTVTAFSGGAATTVYTEEVTITNPLLLPITFENSTLNYEFGDFGGAYTTVIDNPASGGINTSAKVGSQLRTAGSQVWAGTSIALDEIIDFSEFNHFRMKVWSPQAGIPVTLKIENLANSDINHEVEVLTTVANQWEYIYFDFSGTDFSQEYGRLVIFFNLNTSGAGETYYFDDIALVPAPESLTLPLTFEYASVNYIVDEFGGAYGDKVTNPHQEGINTSANVCQVVKTAGAEVYAGVVIPLEAPVDFSSQQKVKMKVWSPQAGITVLMKFENLNDAGINVEVPVTTTTANQWEELTFDFTGINNANNYQKLVVFFDFNVAGTGATYYFDDVQLSN